MKRTALALLLHIAALTGALAQKGLGVNPIFEGRLLPKEQMIEAEVRGSQLKGYNLTLFRSIKFQATEAQRKKIEEMINDDITASTELEKESRHGHLYYAVMTLPPTAGGRPRRFLCYQCAQARDEQYAITLVYMEGHSTLAQLRKTFKKDK